MNRPELPKNKPSRVVAGIIIAVAAALLSPLLASMSLTVIAFTIINAILFSFSGLKIAVFSMLLDVLAFGMVFGAPGAVVAMLGTALPTAVIIRGVYWRRNFFTQITHSVAANVLGIVGALLAARIFVGTDIIGALVEKMRTFMEMLEPGVIDYILDLLYDIEGVPELFSEQQLIDGVLDASRRANYLDGYTAAMSASLRLTMPGSLLSSACLTGIIATAFSAKIMDRRISMPGSYIRLGRWYTPWWISVGILITWAVAWLLTQLGLSGGDAMQLTLQQLMTLVFRVQAAISMERRFIQFNMRPVLRTILIIVFQLFVPIEFVIYYGAFSALFGTTGASVQLQARRMGKKKDN